MWQPIRGVFQRNWPLGSVHFLISPCSALSQLRIDWTLSWPGASVIIGPWPIEQEMVKWHKTWHICHWHCCWHNTSQCNVKDGGDSRHWHQTWHCYTTTLMSRLAKRHWKVFPIKENNTSIYCSNRFLETRLFQLKTFEAFKFWKFFFNIGPLCT